MASHTEPGPVAGDVNYAERSRLQEDAAAHAASGHLHWLEHQPLPHNAPPPHPGLSDDPAYDHGTYQNPGISSGGPHDLDHGPGMSFDPDHAADLGHNPGMSQDPSSDHGGVGVVGHDAGVHDPGAAAHGAGAGGHNTATDHHP